MAIPPKLLPLYEDPLRHNAFYGGRGSGKSWGIAEYCVLRGYERRTRFLCAREVQSSIDDSVKQLLEDTIDRLGLNDFYEIQKTKIIGANGTTFIFKGLRTEDISKVKSVEKIDVCWCEEAQTLSEVSLRTLNPSIRAPGSIIIYSYNPELLDDPIHHRMVVKPGQSSRAVKMNWMDNPYFTDVLNQERIDDYNRDDTPDKHVYKHIWEGECLPAVEGAIFANELSRLYSENRVRPLELDDMGKVYGVMDLGWGVSTMVIAQKFASTVQVIGYGEWRNKTYAEVTADVRGKFPDARWGGIFMPHDASHRDPKYGKSHKDVMGELGWKVLDIPQIGVGNYIEQGRQMFRNVYVSDNEDCEVLLNCLRRFKFKITTDGTKKTGVDKDDASHGGEAWCYTAVVAPQMTNDDHDPSDIEELYREYQSYG